MFRGGVAHQQWIFLARVDVEVMAPPELHPSSSTHYLYFVLITLCNGVFFFSFPHLLN